MKMCRQCEIVLERPVLELNEKIYKFKQRFAQFKSYRQSSINKLNEICDDLIEHRRNVNIANLAGGSTSIIGGALVVAGVFLTPVTLGVSNILTAVGIGLGVLGAGTSVGSKVSESVIEFRKKSLLEEHLSKDNDYGKQVDELLEEIRAKCDSLKKLVEKTRNSSAMCNEGQIISWFTAMNRFCQVGKISKTTFDLVKNIVKLASAGVGRTVFTSSDEVLNVVGFLTRGALQGARAGLAVALGLTSVGAVVDVVFIGFTIRDMKRGNESDCVKKLRGIIQTLEKSLKEFENNNKQLLMIES